MKLSQGETTALIAAFGAVVLSAVIHIGIREWYQPDLRFEVGGYYIADKKAVTSLKIHNHGHSDAEDTILVVNFGFPIQDITTDSRAADIKIKNGAIGDKHLAVSIERLVPGQSLSIFFAIDHGQASPDLLVPNFIQSLTYKGGKGQTGLPIWKNKAMLKVVLVLLLYVPISLYLIFRLRRQFQPHYERISEIIDFTMDAKESGVTKDELLTKVENATKDESFRKKTLQQVAKRVFDSLERRNWPN